MCLVVGEAEFELRSEQQYTGVNEVHQITGRWTRLWSATERIVCNVVRSCTQVHNSNVTS